MVIITEELPKDSGGHLIRIYQVESNEAGLHKNRLDIPRIGNEGKKTINTGKAEEYQPRASAPIGRYVDVASGDIIYPARLWAASTDAKSVLTQMPTQTTLSVFGSIMKFSKNELEVSHRILETAFEPPTIYIPGDAMIQNYPPERLIKNSLLGKQWRMYPEGFFGLLQNHKECLTHDFKMLAREIIKPCVETVKQHVTVKNCSTLLTLAYSSTVMKDFRSYPSKTEAFLSPAVQFMNFLGRGIRKTAKTIFVWNLERLETLKKGLLITCGLALAACGLHAAWLWLRSAKVDAG